MIKATTFLFAPLLLCLFFSIISRKRTVFWRAATCFVLLIEMPIWVGLVRITLTAVLFAHHMGNVGVVEASSYGFARHGTISTAFRPEVQRWEKLITQTANRHNLDPNLLATVIQIESCGDPNAISSAGAMGLGQVMPFHFAADENGFDPLTNLERGASYLAERLAVANGDIRLGLAQYNGGGAALNEANWVAETKLYVEFGYNIYSEIQDGLGSPTLDRWYTQRGRSLCQQAARYTLPAKYQPVRFVAKNSPPSVFGMPYDRYTVTQYYSATHPGVDIVAGCGATIYAPINGTVVFNGTDGYVGPHADRGEENSMLVIADNAGNKVQLLHGLYHVEVGDPTTIGMTVLGKESDIGNATGCHTHLAYLKNGWWVDPLSP